jgi:butyrate kinase
MSTDNKKVQEQIEFSKQLLEMLDEEELSSLDILDALASSGLFLSKAEAGTNPASEAYISRLTKATV